MFFYALFTDVSDNCGVTLAHVAAKEGHVTCLQTLVDHNIDVTSEDRDGRTPTDWAYTAGQTSCARYLVMVEACWLLSVRVAKLHGELKEYKAENAELKKKLGVSFISPDGRPGAKVTGSSRDEQGRPSGASDGESPNGLGHER